MTQSTTTLYRSYIIEEYHLTEEPYYVAVGDEVELFEAAYEQRIPLIFKGPTGCGKTRFVEYMSYRLGQPLTSIKQADSRGVERPEGDNIPLVTIACHEDLTASDLVGRYLLEGDSTVWIDGRRTQFERIDPLASVADLEEADDRLAAPMSGKVIRVLAEAGAAVEAGEPLLVLEAMKMEHTIVAPGDGTIGAIHFNAGDQVEEGAQLVDFERRES